ncbi:hypothetical protein [Synechocystis sp. LKSZ1]|uniref:hypothetical protein n=1 Tax=Synechocystis sp. LKSZ1 TaxID=3144951 RepID=UPI00336BC6F0
MNLSPYLGLSLITSLLLTPALIAANPIQTVKFAPGTSGTTVKGSVIRGERSIYALGAKGGQTMALDLSSVENNAVFQIYAPGARQKGDEIVGQTLPGAGETDDASRWQGKLPRSGQYWVVVGGTRGNASYQLKISIR